MAHRICRGESGRRPAQAASVHLWSCRRDLHSQARTTERRRPEIRAPEVRMTASVTTPSEPVLRLSGLAVATAGKTLLVGIDLELLAGELVALIGPSGCGKTTLLRAITGLCNPAAGKARLHGHCPDEMRWPCFRRQTVLVDQRPVLLDESVRENLVRPFGYRTANSAFSAEKARKLLSRLGLKDGVLDQAARSLSQGEQQRVCLARALLIEPAVLLLDEPTSALDEDSVENVEKILCEEVHRRNLAALIVTHDRRQAERWCDRIVDLKAYGPNKQGAV
jgi:ABC-type iron transport system FetAB ATPase subunit